MKQLLIVFFTLIPCAASFGWGDDTHRAITRGAIAALPEDLGLFMQVNCDFIARHSTDPDYIPDRTPEQRAEHFLDLDLYKGETIPHDRAEAEKKFGRDIVIQRGLLPWTIDREYKRLVKAFKEKDREEARLAAAFLAHFVADATMPLHATSNYDGQLTGQNGIHGRIEYELDRRYHDSPMVFANKPGAKADPLEWAFKELQKSMSLVQPVLDADLEARKTSVLDSEGYYRELEKQCGDQIESRIRDAASALAAFYQSAWEEAGKPKLPPETVAVIIFGTPNENFIERKASAKAVLLDEAKKLNKTDAVALIVADAPKYTWRFTVPWNSADYERDPELSYSGASRYALSSALLTFKQAPHAKKRLIVIGFKSPDEEDPALASEFKNMGVKVEKRNAGAEK